VRAPLAATEYIATLPSPLPVTASSPPSGLKARCVGALAVTNGEPATAVRTPLGEIA
jgi:hypothetical protein